MRASLGGGSKVFVAVDAPRLQETIFTHLGERAFITPGVGVDPTNEYRDGDAKWLKNPQYQQTAKQDLSELNLIKVSLDYYIQGFCLSSMTLRPSAFYAAAGLRTSAIRGAVWDHVLANLTVGKKAAAGGGRMPSCMTEQAGSRPASSLDACQREICGVDSCNLNQ